MKYILINWGIMIIFIFRCICIKYGVTHVEYNKFTRNPFFLSIFNDHYSSWIWLSRYQKLYLDFIGARDDGDGGDNWSCKKCKAAVKLSSSKNQHNTQFFAGWMPFLSPNQQYVSTEGNQESLLWWFNYKKLSWCWQTRTILVILGRTMRDRIIAYFRFSKWRPSAILDFHIFTIFVKSSNFCLYLYRCAKFGEDRTIRGWIIVHLIFDFQNDGRPPSWIWYDVIVDHPRRVFDWWS